MCKRTELKYLLTPYIKINSKWIKDLSVRTETIKLGGKHRQYTLFDINHSKIFFDLPPKIMEIKAKINKWDLIRLKSYCCSLCQRMFCFSRSFIVSGPTFRSLIHFEFIFMYGVRECSNLIFYRFSFSIPLIKEAIFAPLYILASFVKNKVPTSAWVYFWAFDLAPFVCISVFVPVPYCLDDYSFVI